MKYTVNIIRTRTENATDTKSTAVQEVAMHDAGGQDITSQAIRTKLVLHAAPGEVAWHIALKILGYLLFMEYAPRIEEGIGWHYKPDLVSLDTHGALRLWVDCGNIAVRKIDRVAQKVGQNAPFVILRKTHRDAMHLAQSLGKLRFPERVHIASFDKGFVDTLANSLDATNHITAQLQQGPHATATANLPAPVPQNNLTLFSGMSLQIKNRKGDSTLTSTITLIQPQTFAHNVV